MALERLNKFMTRWYCWHGGTYSQDCCIAKETTLTCSIQASVGGGGKIRAGFGSVAANNWWSFTSFEVFPDMESGPCVDSKYSLHNIDSRLIVTIYNRTEFWHNLKTGLALLLAVRQSPNLAVSFIMSRVTTSNISWSRLTTYFREDFSPFICIIP